MDYYFVKQPLHDTMNFPFTGSWSYKAEILGGSRGYSEIRILYNVVVAAVDVKHGFFAHRGLLRVHDYRMHFYTNIRRKKLHGKTVYQVEKLDWTVVGDFKNYDYRIIDKAGNPMAAVSLETIEGVENVRIQIFQGASELSALSTVLFVEYDLHRK